MYPVKVIWGISIILYSKTLNDTLLPLVKRNLDPTGHSRWYSLDLGSSFFIKVSSIAHTTEFIFGCIFLTM